MLATVAENCSNSEDCNIAGAGDRTGHQTAGISLVAPAHEALHDTDPRTQTVSDAGDTVTETAPSLTDKLQHSRSSRPLRPRGSHDPPPQSPDSA